MQNKILRTIEFGNLKPLVYAADWIKI